MIGRARHGAAFAVLLTACTRGAPAPSLPGPPGPPPPACVAHAEVCDGLDNDCDGATDGPGLSGAPACGGAGVCAHGARPCVAGAFVDCGAGDFPPSFQTREASCDDLDNDCDGRTDARCAWTVDAGTELGRLADVAWAPDGSIVVSDADRRAVVRLAAGAPAETLLGPGAIHVPAGLAVGPDGTVYVADVAGHRVLVHPPGGPTRVLAGAGEAGFTDGHGASAKFHQPVGLALGADGTLYVADLSNHAVRAVAPDGTVTTVAGTGAPGYADGPAAAASFDNPRGVAVGPDGALYVADAQNHALRRIADGEVTTVAGGSGPGFADGPGLSALLDGPGDVAADARGVFVADSRNHAVRVYAGGSLTTLAGNGQAGSADGLGAAARFSLPGGLAAGEGFDLLVADPGSRALRRVRP